MFLRILKKISWRYLKIFNVNIASFYYWTCNQYLLSCHRRLLFSQASSDLCMYPKASLLQYVKKPPSRSVSLRCFFLIYFLLHVIGILTHCFFTRKIFEKPDFHLQVYISKTFRACNQDFLQSPNKELFCICLLLCKIQHI